MSVDQADTPLLEVTNLEKSYRALKAINGVSFTVRTGEVLGVIGPNGAGKTSLMNALAGTPPSDAGQILFEGHSIEKLPAYRRTRLGIVRTFQRVDLFRDLTGIDNVCAGYENDPSYGVFRAVFGTRRKKDRQRTESAKALLRVAGLPERLWHQPVTALGHGEQRLVEMARAMAAQPRLLLMDEPTVGLRERDIERLNEWIGELQRTGTGVVVVSHDMQFVLDRSDRVLVLHFGRELAYGAPNEVRNHEAVIAAYLGEG